MSSTCTEHYCSVDVKILWCFLESHYFITSIRIIVLYILHKFVFDCSNKTFAFIALNGIDGDPVVGICYVGNHDLTHLRLFVLVPLIVYLFFGTLFLLVGFVCMFRIRSAIKAQGSAKTDKLECLMLRLGVVRPPSLFLSSSSSSDTLCSRNPLRNYLLLLAIELCFQSAAAAAADDDDD